jgi:DNA-directed RNA polymerase specialized sigma subunit
MKGGDKVGSNGNGEKKDKVFEAYRMNQAFINRLAKRYSRIDPSVDYEDLVSEGYLAILEALEKYDSNRGDLDFSCYFWWHLQKAFSSILRSDKVVEIKHDGGEEVISYEEFLRRKREFPEGTEWKVQFLNSSLEEFREKMGDIQ